MRLQAFILALPVFLASPAAFFFIPHAKSETFDGLIDISVRVVIPLLCYYAMFKVGLRRKDLGLMTPFGKMKSTKFFVICILCTLAFLVFVPLGNYAAFFLGDPQPNVSSLEIGSRFTYTPMSILYNACSAGFFEEVGFRGLLAYLLVADRNWARGLLFIVISSIAFAASHLTKDLADIVSFLYVGVMSAILYLRLGNLWPLVVAHTASDLIVLTALARA